MEQDKTLNTSSVESTALYQDASGRGAKIATPVAPEGSADKNRGTIAAKPSSASPHIQSPDEVRSPVPFSEHIESLFDGEDLSEAFKNKAEVIFEAAVNERLTLLEDELKIAVEESFEIELETFKEELTERIDDYLNYVVEEWVKENEVAVEKGLRTEVAESFIGGLKTLFESNFIDIPDEKVDVLEEMIKENEEMTEILNEAINANIELNSLVENYRKSEIFSEIADDLSDVQVDKFSRMAEGIEFEDDESFAHKLGILKESYFNGVTRPVNDTEEIASNAEVLNENSNNAINRYVNELNKQARSREIYEA
mgnify:FL=1